MIRLAIPSIEEADIQAVRDVLATGILVQGAKVAGFEEQVANYVGAKYAVAVSNCTAALHLSLLALNLQPGDMVIVPAYSWIATANVVELCGAQPVFVDICSDTFNIDPNHLESTLSRLMAIKETSRRVKTIIPVHAFGQVADMPPILELASRYELTVVEDAACALGATLQNRQAGKWGTIGCFSFHPRKAITTGEGGIAVTDDSNIASRLRALRNHGQDPYNPKPDFIIPGFNYRMTEFQAALGITQMAKLDRIIATRRRLAACYDEMLKESPVQVPQSIPDGKPVYQSYVLMLKTGDRRHRDELIAHLKGNGVEATIGTWHMPTTTYYRTHYGYKTGDFPATDYVFDRALTLPLHVQLNEEQQKEIVRQIRLWFSA